MDALGISRLARAHRDGASGPPASRGDALAVLVHVGLGIGFSSLHNSQHHHYHTVAVTLVCAWQTTVQCQRTRCCNLMQTGRNRHTRHSLVRLVTYCQHCSCAEGKRRAAESKQAQHREQNPSGHQKIFRIACCRRGTFTTWQDMRASATLRCRVAGSFRAWTLTLVAMRARWACTLRVLRTQAPAPATRTGLDASACMATLWVAC